MQNLRSIPLREQTFEVWRRHRFLITLFLLTVIADFLSTIAFMNLVGIEVEKSLLVRLLALNFGILLGTFVGKCAQVFSAWGFSMFSPRLAAFVIGGLALLNMFAVQLNVRVVYAALPPVA